MQLKDLMSDYFQDDRTLLNETRSKSISTIPSELPIQPNKKSNWEKKSNPKRMVKIFKISNEQNFNNFIIDVLEMQSENGHHGRISIQYPKVKMEIWTHTLMDITEMDLEWIKKVDDIYEGYKSGNKK
tara:strand:+ start:1017 stop:1400 length:384 start_codon:yes stop_codon:yes gene_type:complete